MAKICDMEGVREYMEGFPVELWRHEKTGRLVIRAQNEDHNNATDVDLWDLLGWLSIGPGDRLLLVGREDDARSDGEDAKGN